jgi:uncharacterized membrane protein YgdD (TMEM256/DUF423 family)
MNQKNSLLAGAILGGLGVALGAFGAHALKAMLTETGRLDTFELAVRYEFYHAFALLVTGLAQQFIDSKFLKTAAGFFFFGSILFSGSLYAVCLTDTTVFAMATPLGGVLLIIGWLLLALGIYSKK